MATRRYLDAGGRAPVHPVAHEAFLAALEQGWADPRRLHAEGRRARLLLDGAREALAEMLGVRTEEIHLTAGHTASLHAPVVWPGPDDGWVAESWSQPTSGPPCWRPRPWPATKSSPCRWTARDGWTLSLIH